MGSSQPGGLDCVPKNLAITRLGARAASGSIRCLGFLYEANRRKMLYQLKKKGCSTLCGGEQKECATLGASVPIGQPFRMQSSTSEFIMQDAEIMPKAWVPSSCTFYICVEAVLCFSVEASRSRTDAHQPEAMHSQLILTSNSDFDCDSAASTLHCRIRVNRGFTSEFDCDFRIQTWEQGRS